MPIEPVLKLWGRLFVGSKGPARTNTNTYYSRIQNSDHQHQAKEFIKRQHTAIQHTHQTEARTYNSALSNWLGGTC